MLSRPDRWLQFHIERFLLGGSHYRLLVIAAALGLVSVAGGSLIWWVEPFDDPSGAGPMAYGEHVWWAFLRLSDPGYLGDDVGAFRRTVSTVITLCGYVLFMGALVAIMTQSLNSTIRRLERGLTPVALSNHVVILGWNERTPELVAELMSSEGRLRRFLAEFRIRKLRVAVLIEDVAPEHEVALRERLGARYVRGRIILRSGSPLRIEDLHRVAVMGAAAVVVTDEPQLGEAADADARLVKTLLTIARSCDGQVAPLVVAAIADPRKRSVAEAAYPVGRVELLSSSAVIGRLLAQSLRHPGLTHVFDEILTHSRGNELYVRRVPELIGRRFDELTHAFEDAVVLGKVKLVGGDVVPHIHPPADERVGDDEKLVLLSEDYDVHVRSSPPRRALAEQSVATTKQPALRRLLMLGWNHVVPSILSELSGLVEPGLVVDLVSGQKASFRAKRLVQYGATIEGFKVNQIEADFTLPVELGALKLESYDAILILGSDRTENVEDADARTLLAFQLVQSALRGVERPPHVLLELRDPSNASLCSGTGAEVLATSLVVGRVLAQIALRRELGAVFDVLLGPGGPEMAFRSAADYGLAGPPCTFDDVLARVAAHGDVALGWRIGPPIHGELSVNPPRARTVVFAPQDAILVLSEQGD